MPHEIEHRNVLTITELASFLQCSKTHVSNVLNGKVPGVSPLAFVAIGRRKFVKREWLDQWMESNRTA